MTKDNGDRPRPLVRWNQFSRFVQILLWSGHASNGAPQSLIAVSEPGEGKTELLNRFDRNETTTYYSDLTSRTIVSILRNEVARPPAGKRPVTHVVCTEFQKVITRRRSVAEPTCVLILQSMWDGVGKVGHGPQTYDCYGALVGWLLATTMTSLGNNPYIIRELAMDSRAYLVDFSATDEELREIERRMVVGDQSALKKVTLRNVPEEKVSVDVPRRVAADLQLFVEEMRRKHVRVYGVRTMARFLNTLRGVTLSHGRDVATKADTEELYTFRDMWLRIPELRKPSHHRETD